MGHTSPCSSSSSCPQPLAFSAPMPEGDEAPVAEVYTHDATGDVAVPYVHEEIAAEAYNHEEIPAEEYVHEDIAAVPYVQPVVAPVVYASYPYHAGFPYAAAPVTYAAAPVVKDAPKVTYAAAPVTGAVAYAGHYPYVYGHYAVHTGCVNNVGSVVPCA